MERKKIVAGNWKMNKTTSQGKELVAQIMAQLPPSEIKVVVAPPFTLLSDVARQLEGLSHISLGAQNCHQKENGAYTGEVSAAMLQSIGVQYVILGHSERRQYFAESDILVAEKIDAVLAQHMIPIYCCGEVLQERENELHFEVVGNQLLAALFHLPENQLIQVVIAYEPVWAIGTGKTASPQQAQEMHAFIRTKLAQQYGQKIADQISILYGGSCKPDNAADIFSQPDVDGGLIGGASLKAEDFVAIAKAFS